MSKDGIKGATQKLVGEAQEGVGKVKDVINKATR